mgnify:CR=1 FL=1
MTGLESSDRYLMVNPYFHMFGLKAGILASVAAGATMLPEPVFDVNLLRVQSEQAMKNLEEQVEAEKQRMKAAEDIVYDLRNARSGTEDKINKIAKDLNGMNDTVKSVVKQMSIESQARIGQDVKLDVSHAKLEQLVTRIITNLPFSGSRRAGNCANLKPRHVTLAPHAQLPNCGLRLTHC